MVDDTRHTTDADTLRDLRRVRREIRLGDTEWFDVLYRVYLFALVGSIAIIFASDSINGLVKESLTTEQILSRGPSLAGIAAAVAFAIGLRNGSDGGPVSIESADIVHVLMSPIDRRRVLLRPIVQRLRSVAFALSLGLGVLGQLVAREIDGSRAAWAASGAGFGVLLAVLYVATAVVSHAIGVPRWLASVIGSVGVTWQSFAAWQTWIEASPSWLRIGPTNLDGSVLFWGIRQRNIDWIAIGLAAVLLLLALALGGKLRLEPLERRGQLVSLLRFAATVQDIRTVVLLRRQLRAESVRSRPWFDRRRSAAPVGGTTHPATRPQRSAAKPKPGFVWRRGFTALRRLPLGRLGRISALSAVAGASASFSVSESPVLLVVFVIAVFFVGLESLEPLAQEIDHPDLTDAVPVARGWLFLHHLVAPAVLLGVAGLIGATTATAIEPSQAAPAFLLALPLAWAGSIGAIVSTVRDAPEPAGVASTTLFGGDRGGESPFALPEFAGFNNIITGAMPIVLSAIAAIPLLGLRITPDMSTVARSTLGVTLCLMLLGLWVVRRDRWAAQLREFFAAGRADAQPSKTESTS